MATRRERVVLELEDHFSTAMARAAAATAVLQSQLDGLSRESIETSKTTRQVDKDVDGLGKTSKRTEKDIDKLSGRLRLLADVAAFVGPSLAPIGAVGIAGVSGLASELGFATIGAGVAVLAFQGIGDTLKAVNKAALDPTVANLKAARVALADLSPEARGFVQELRGLAPELKHLRDVAGDGLFPGLTRGLVGLESALPRVEILISAIATELGTIAEDTGESLGSDRWAPFLNFVGTEGPAALSDLAAAIGNTTHGLAELWMATDPLNDSFSSWLVEVTRDFDRWAEGLSQTQGFEEFINYVQTNGPQVAETAGAIGNAFLQIAEAVAPLGGPSLRILESLADALATIADSPAGTSIFGVVAAMGALNTAARVYASLAKGTFGGPAISAIVANEAAMGRLGLTTSRATSALAGLKRGAGLAAVAVVGLQVAHELLEKSDPTKPVNKFADAFAGLALDSEDAKRNLDGLFTADNSNWSRLLNGKASLDGITAAFKALNASDFTKLGNFGRSTFGTFDTEADLATSAVKKADEALAELASGGSLDAAQKGFDYLAQQAAAAGMSTSEFTALFPQYEGAVQRAGGATGSWTAELHKNMVVQEQSAAAMEAARTAAKEEASGFLEFGNSVDDSRVSLSDWISTMHDQAVALEQFTENARKAGKRGLREGLIKELETLGPVGAFRMKQLADATESEIRRANREWARGRGAMADWVAFKVPAKEITVNTAPALRQLRSLKSFMASISGSTPTPSTDQGLSGLLGTNTNNDGTVDRDGNPRTGKGLAPGGTVPKTGLPYADRHLYMLADGEEVISNRFGQADRHRGLLKAINNDAFGSSTYELAAGGAVPSSRSLAVPTLAELQGVAS